MPDDQRLRAQHEALMRKWERLSAGSWRGIRLMGIFSISYALGCLTVVGLRDPHMLPWGLGLFVAGAYTGVQFVLWRWQGTLDAQRAFFERSGNDVIEAVREGRGDG